jgi:hypothetical protein
MEPFITDGNISELDKPHDALIKSIRPLDICAEISKKLSNNLKHLLPNNLVKKYTILKYTDSYSSGIKPDRSLIQWARFLFDYNRISFDSNYITPTNLEYDSLDNRDMTHGIFRHLINTIQNSDIYRKPHILSTEHSKKSSSVSPKSNIDAIMNIGKSLVPSL